MGKATSKYEMSRETEAMFDVYTALINFEAAVLGGLSTAYGEEEANKIFNEKYVDQLQELEKTVFEDIRYNVWESLSTNRNSKEAAIII